MVISDGNKWKSVMIRSAVWNGSEAHFFEAVSRGVRYGHNAAIANTIQRSTIQYDVIQHNTILYNTIQYNTMQYNTM